MGRPRIESRIIPGAGRPAARANLERIHAIRRGAAGLRRAHAVAARFAVAVAARIRRAVISPSVLLSCPSDHPVGAGGQRVEAAGTYRRRRRGWNWRRRRRGVPVPIAGAATNVVVERVRGVHAQLMAGQMDNIPTTIPVDALSVHAYTGSGAAHGAHGTIAASRRRVAVRRGDREKGAAVSWIVDAHQGRSSAIVQAAADRRRGIEIKVVIDAADDLLACRHAARHAEHAIAVRAGAIRADALERRRRWRGRGRRRWRRRRRRKDGV